MRTLKLKDIGVFYTGLSGKSKNDFSNGNALFVTYSNIFNNPVLNLKITDTVVVKEGEKQNEVKCGDILFTGSSETPDEAGMSSVVLSVPKEKMYLNSFCFGYRLNNTDEISPAYMGYILRSASIRNAISKTAFGVTRFNINKNKFADIEVPIPSLSTQQKIVSVLDSFTTLIDKMKQEVEKRKKQMEYYREKLLTFEDGECERKKVSEFCELKAGKAIKASELNEIQTTTNPYPCYGGNGIRGYIAKKSHTGDYSVIGRQGALCGCVNWASGDFYATEHAVVVTPREGVESEFLRIMFTYADLNQYKSQGAQPGLAVSNLNELIFTIPSLTKQSEIVSTLDKFESYITKLEKMIVLRQKQYEYYREQLLTFENIKH